MNVLVINAGSSSLKFQLIATNLERIAADTDVRLARGMVDRIGGEALLNFSAGEKSLKTAQPIRDHRAAVDAVLRWLGSAETGLGGVKAIDAVGHRVVHGGERFKTSELIDEKVLLGIEDNIDLAPLHNPHNLKGIAATTDVLGATVPQVAVFDTAFHHTLPDYAYLYAIPYSLYRRYRVRRYGFHGTSHRYVAYRYRRLKGLDREGVNVVTLHLGNGCSACAIKGGRSIDTSMGFTPLEGLVMGTRSGDLDPAILDFIAAKEGLTLTEIESLLNKQSGMLGISGLTHDMRELLAEEAENADRRARLAIEIFCYRIRKYIGSYIAAMNGADAIIFTGGIGENACDVRRRVLEGLDWLGIRLDNDANDTKLQGAEGLISTPDSRVEAWVVPTDEELLIARDTVRVITRPQSADL